MIPEELSPVQHDLPGSRMAAGEEVPMPGTEGGLIEPERAVKKEPEEEMPGATLLPPWVLSSGSPVSELIEVKTEEEVTTEEGGIIVPSVSTAAKPAPPPLPPPHSSAKGNDTRVPQGRNMDHSWHCTE